jgi:hypothetical protein
LAALQGGQAGAHPAIKTLEQACGVWSTTPRDQQKPPPDRRIEAVPDQRSHQSGVAPEATVQFVAFPGDEAPRLVRIVTPQGELPGASRWLQLIDCRFEAAATWGRGIDLVERARWGWFGVEGPGLAWEALGLR